MSAVIVAFAGGESVRRPLAALAPQCEALGVEVVVAHEQGSIEVERLAALFPFARWVAAPPGSSPARLRTLGVLASSGAVVACTEDHCTPNADWCARILAAHAPEGEARVVGGAIDVPASAPPAAWAAYLLDYSRYMPPLDGAPAQASDCNVSYRRASLDAVSAAWRDEFHENVVHAALSDAGVPLRADASIVVVEERHVALGPYLRERVGHGRLFAATRVSDAAGATRLRLAAQSFVLPAALVARVVARLRARRRLGRVPNGAWPRLAVAAAAWSMGELAGYITRRPR